MKALVIDSNDEWSYLIQKTLYGEGYKKVERANKPQQAINHLDSQVWDLVVSVLRFNLTDVIYPNPDIPPVEWIKALRRKLRSNNSCPVVFLQDLDDTKDYQKELWQKFPCAILPRVNYTEQNFKEAINSAKHRYHSADWIQAPFNIVYKNSLLNKHVFITIGTKHYMLNPNDIYYLNSKDGHIHVYLEDINPKYIVRQSISNIVHHLPTDKFFSPHRGFLVNIEKIDYIDSKNRFVSD